jgi:hypothetical protein
MLRLEDMPPLARRSHGIAGEAKLSIMIIILKTVL